jgi:hypothetical protein
MTKEPEDRVKWTNIEKRFELHDQEIATLTTVIDKFGQRLDQKIEEDRQKWAENQRQWEEKREEDRQKSAENKQHKEQNRQEIKKVFSKVDQKLGAIGARWGIQSEASFRNSQAFYKNLKAYKLFMLMNMMMKVSSLAIRKKLNWTSLLKKGY